MSDLEALPTTAQQGWPGAVVLGAYRTGVLAVRALRRRGVRTTLVDCDPTQTGFRSRHGPPLLCPNPDAEPERWLAGRRRERVRSQGAARWGQSADCKVGRSVSRQS